MASHHERRAEIYRLATEVLGNADLAKRWMLEPAIGLNQQVPAELIGTPEGAELVETYLMQIEFASTSSCCSQAPTPGRSPIGQILPLG